MAGFRIDQMQLEADTAALRAAGNGLTTAEKNISDEGVSTLPASRCYIEQHKRIGELLELYKQLVEKDVQDIINMKRAAHDADRSAASLFGKK